LFQAVFEMCFDFESEVGFGFVDGGEGVFDIALAFEVKKC
jgi:hypothetical protein